MIKKLRIAWVLLLALLAGPAFAFGLGRIEVKSQRDQPLLAEIQIISSDPAELDQLQARLASPDTFARIGLEPPQGIVSDLQFTVALDVRGNPVIRVTSQVPVQQPLLTFLIEVDWGQGRLVREYSVLLDAPRTVSAPAQPPIEAPVAAPSNTIVRPAETPVAATPAPEAEPAATPAPEAATPDPDAVAATPAPAPVAPPPPSPSIAPIARPSEYGPVQAGDTLSEIAAGMVGEANTLDQTMLALLRANPEAFIGDNINLVRQGAVLRIPRADELSEYSASEAATVVRQQIAQWREMRRPAPQPEAVASADEGAPAAATAGAGTADNAPRVADARLEIVPPSQGSGQRAGTRSGIEAGGEGEMLRQELQQSNETLAAREAEVEELKARVADLEQLQAQQQQLINLKDSELAAAQQRLAASNQQPAPTLAQATAQPADPALPPAPGAEGSALMWLWVGLALLIAGALAWLLTRRRKTTSPARSFDTAALAAGMPKAPDATRTDDVASASMAPAAAAAASTPTPPPTSAPTWNAPGLQSVEMAPTWHAGGQSPSPPTPGTGATIAPLNSAPAGQERLELARAYLDLGDVDTARSLLREVADSGDTGARDEASRLLRELA